MYRCDAVVAGLVVARVQWGGRAYRVRRVCNGPAPEHTTRTELQPSPNLLRDPIAET